MKKKGITIPLKIQLVIILSFVIYSYSKSQCPVISYPSDTVVYADTGVCGAVVNYSIPYILDTCLGNQLFTYTGDIQTFVVPQGVTEIGIKAVGAAGGGQDGTIGGYNFGNYSSGVGTTGTIGGYYFGEPGRGAGMKGTFSVTPGQVLNILVGEKGHDGRYTGGGGGGTFVWDAQTNDLLIAAGGGGGAGVTTDNSVTFQNGMDATIFTEGTNGNMATNGQGTDGYGGTEVTGYTAWASAGAGWFSDGAFGSVHNCVTLSTGGRSPLNDGSGGTGGGSAGDGGFGGGGGGNGRCGAVAGGGGGGYSGGGGGVEIIGFGGGGGGGSYNAGINQSNVAGIGTGNGYVEIVFDVPEYCEFMLVQGMGSGSFFPVGTTEETYQLVDISGDTITVSFNITVIDSTPPVPDVSNLPVIINECSVSLSSPTATDACGGTITATTYNPTYFSVPGTYNVEWIYDNGYGNITTQTQTVIVENATMPVPAIDPLPVISATCSVNLTPPVAYDNCFGTITATTDNPLVYNVPGTYNVTWTYNEGFSNSITQTQTVIIDYEAPVPDYDTLPVITEQCFASLTPPTATDACGGTITAITYNPTSFSVQGTYNVEWIYDNGYGGITTQTQTVIIDDNIAPVPDSDTLPEIFAECSAVLVPPTATDNCAGLITATSLQTLSLNDVGYQTITWVFDDGNGNVTYQSQNVIIDDVTAPSITCPYNQTVFTNTNYATYHVSGIEFNPVFVADNCNIISIENNYNFLSTLAGADFDIGTTNVYWLVSDGGGNYSACNFDITVVDANTKSLIDNSVEVFPNPSNGNFVIRCYGQEDYLITISDITGKIVYKNYATAGSIDGSIKVENIAQGTYKLTLQSENNVINRQIIVTD